MPSCPFAALASGSSKCSTGSLGWRIKYVRDYFEYTPTQTHTLTHKHTHSHTDTHTHTHSQRSTRSEFELEHFRFPVLCVTHLCGTLDTCNTSNSATVNHTYLYRYSMHIYILRYVAYIFRWYWYFDIDIYFVVHTFRFCVRFSFFFVAFANFNYDMEN